MKANAKRRGRPRKPGPRDQSDRLIHPSLRDEREAAMLAVVEARGRALDVWPAPLKRGIGEPDDAWSARQEARKGMIRATIPYVTLPWNGCACGRHIRGEKDVSDLWQIIKLIRGRHAAYQAAICAPRLAPDVLAAGAAENGVGSGVMVADVPVDLRTYEERNAHAIRDWERLKALSDWSRLFEVIDDTPTQGFIAWLRLMGLALLR